MTKGILEKKHRVPAGVRSLMAKGMGAVSVDVWEGLCKGVYPFLPGRMRYKHPGERVHKLTRILSYQKPEDVYRLLISSWQEPESVVIDEKGDQGSAASETNAFSRIVSDLEELDLSEKMMPIDTLTYLPDDIMAKVDRASMGVSLESRAPFLDHKIVDFAWTLPLEFKVKNGEGKLILKDMLSRHVPRSITERPKKGFGVPLEQWLRGPLGEWAEELLSEGTIRRQGYLRPEPIRK